MEPGDKVSNKKFSLPARIKSFRNAFSGLSLLLRYEHNFRIHLVVLLIVIIAGFLFRITATEWIAVITISALVLAAECFNSALEYLSDAVSPDINPAIKKVKDIAAGGVLITAILAVIAGVIIFLPRIIALINSAGSR
jgi:diacylglycerol kinase